MTTASQSVGERRVELRHTATVDQYREALRAHAKVSRAARRQRWMVIAVAVLLVVSAVRLGPDGGRVYPVQLLLAVVFVLLAFVVLPRLQARRAYRTGVSRGGERRIVVDESGVSVETDHTAAHHGWPSLSRYVESRRLFVLLSGGKREACLVFVPKQDADGTDRSELLRALLMAHLG
ncbi:YcxB family protein [Streptomyces massasporeus]|uniref:YcxB family protein n=1 Tax=Streptomyces massasporeus TaxID=67324 RepID=UPI0033EF73B2